MESRFRTQCLAMLLVAFAPRWLPFWTILMLRVLDLFPLGVFLATLLHLMGRNVWFDWLMEQLRF